jgi:RpiR family carbohydrate utilization transcriptional regulator
MDIMNPTRSAKPVSTVLEVIEKRRDGLRASEKLVADLILKDPVTALDFNMAGLADAAGVSEPTVMRFCSAIGYDGFRSFKISLAQTIALGLPVTLSAIDQNDTNESVIDKVFSHTISSLDRARRNIDSSAIVAAVDLIMEATELVFVGSGASGVVAIDAQQKFPLFGVPCQAPTDYHQQFIAASMCTPKTVVFAISNTGRTKTTLRVAEEAKRSGGVVISLTGEEGPLSSVADLDINARTFEDTDYYTPTVSRLAALVVVDILATAVALRRGTDYLSRIQVMKERLSKERG